MGTRLFDLYLGLFGLGVVLYFVLGTPENSSATASIVQQLGRSGGDFIGSLEGR